MWRFRNHNGSLTSWRATFHVGRRNSHSHTSTITSSKSVARDPKEKITRFLHWVNSKLLIQVLFGDITSHNKPVNIGKDHWKVEVPAIFDGVVCWQIACAERRDVLAALAHTPVWSRPRSVAARRPRRPASELVEPSCLACRLPRGMHGTRPPQAQAARPPVRPSGSTQRPTRTH